MQESLYGSAIPVGQHVYQCPALDVGEDRSKPLSLDLVEPHPDRRFSLELLFQLQHIGIEHIAHGLLIDANLLGHFCKGVLKCLPSNPLLD